MLLDDFSVIEYKDEDISQEDLRTVLRMFADIVQELIRPKTKKKKSILSSLLNKKEGKLVNDETVAREAIEHDLYQQHEHLQDEEIKEVEEKVNHQSIIHPAEKTEEKSTKTATVGEEKTENSGAAPEEVIAEPSTETTSQESDKDQVMWTGEDVPEFSEIKEEKTETTEVAGIENNENEGVAPIEETETTLEASESEKDLETNVATETSWIADAPVAGNNDQETGDGEDDEDDFPFQSPTEDKSKVSEENSGTAPKEEISESVEKKVEEIESTKTEAKDTDDDFPFAEEETSTDLPQLENTPVNEQVSKATESVGEDLDEVISDLDIGLEKKEENQAATDLKDLAQQLKEVIKREHLEGEYQEKTALSVEVDNIDKLIETSERLIVEKNFQEAKNVYQEVMGKYNELNEEEKHKHFDKIQLLYNLLAHH